MSADLATSFITYYIRSLGERTRAERRSTKFGFDWIIYNLALAEGLIPHRLPFIRGGPDEISKTKTEAEFGIDSSFLSSDKKTLTIFVLKDEVLSNSNWTANDFDVDLRKASTPDLTSSELKSVRNVTIILAYNKDEDQTGIKLFENLAKSLSGKIYGNVKLDFERWNLSILAELTKNKLLNPSLLPQKFFSHFGYICSQLGDFRHGSDEWDKQLIPSWRRFLEDLLKEDLNERSARLIPVTLIIIREYGKGNPSAETGWLDLAEWAMIMAWRAHQTSTNNSVKTAIEEMWSGFYLAELERFYQKHSAHLESEHSMEVGNSGSYIDAIASSVVALWHIARLGILGIAQAETLDRLGDDSGSSNTRNLQQTANWMVSVINGNPAAMRPLIDLHHIEIFLIWRILWQVDRLQDIYHWLLLLHPRLLLRRAGSIPIPFVEGGNSIDLVFEYVATGNRPPEFCDQSSLLILCILELCFCLPKPQRDEILDIYYRQIVIGPDANSSSNSGSEPLDLMGWAPPEDWADKILIKSLADEGNSLTLQLFNSYADDGEASIAERIESFVRQSRDTKKDYFPPLPLSVVILSCLKLRTPLPAEIWRRSIFN